MRIKLRRLHRSEIIFDLEVWPDNRETRHDTEMKDFATSVEHGVDAELGIETASLGTK